MRGLIDTVIWLFLLAFFLLALLYLGAPLIIKIMEAGR